MVIMTETVFLIHIWQNKSWERKYNLLSTVILKATDT